MNDVRLDGGDVMLIQGSGDDVDVLLVGLSSRTTRQAAEFLASAFPVSAAPSGSDLESDFDGERLGI